MRSSRHPIVRRNWRRSRTPMISVIIPTLNAEATLAADPGGAGAGGGRRADPRGDRGRWRLQRPDGRHRRRRGRRAGARQRRAGQPARAGAAQARFPWLLFLHADTVLAPGWEREASLFMERVDSGARPVAAAAFRFALDDVGARPRLLERLVALRCAALRLPYGDQGLLIPKRLYDEIGGYRPLAADGGCRPGAPARPPAHRHAAARAR